MRTSIWILVPIFKTQFCFLFNSVKWFFVTTIAYYLSNKSYTHGSNTFFDLPERPRNRSQSKGKRSRYASISLQGTSTKTGCRWCAGWKRRRQTRRLPSCTAGPGPWTITGTRRCCWALNGWWTAACSSGRINSSRWCWSSAATSTGWTTAAGRWSRTPFTTWTRRSTSPDCCWTAARRFGSKVRGPRFRFHQYRTVSNSGGWQNLKIVVRYTSPDSIGCSKMTWSMRFDAASPHILVAHFFL